MPRTMNDGRAPSARAMTEVAGGHVCEDAMLEEARFLHWFGQETIAFNRGYVGITGNVVSALWLCFVLERLHEEVRTGRACVVDEHYQFRLTSADCEAETGITRAQQAGCRAQLEALGLLKVEGVRGKVACYTVNLRRLREIMTEQSRPLLAALQQARMQPVTAENWR